MLCLIVYCLFFLSSFSTASIKKGFGLCHFQCGDTYALSNATWWYNWFYTFEQRDTCPLPTRGEYIPMVWGEKTINTAVIPPESKHVLGFNEPNAENQANMSPERCAELWPKVEAIAGNRTLISPALAGCDFRPDMCIAWYDRFFNACRTCRVDKIAVHAYQCVPYELMASLERISTRYNRPIWLTEFACHGYVTSYEQQRFIKLAVPMLEQASFVERYAWYCSRRTRSSPYMPNLSSSLLNLYGPSLSDVGQDYNTF